MVRASGTDTLATFETGLLCAVVIHAYAVEQSGGSLSGPDVRKGVVKILHGELHGVLGVLQIFLYFHFYIVLLIFNFHRSIPSFHRHKRSDTVTLEHPSQISSSSMLKT